MCTHLCEYCARFPQHQCACPDSRPISRPLRYARIESAANRFRVLQLGVGLRSQQEEEERLVLVPGSPLSQSRPCSTTSTHHDIMISGGSACANPPRTECRSEIGEAIAMALSERLEVTITHNLSDAVEVKELYSRQWIALDWDARGRLADLVPWTDITPSPGCGMACNELSHRDGPVPMRLERRPILRRY